MPVASSSSLSSSSSSSLTSSSQFGYSSSLTPPFLSICWSCHSLVLFCLCPVVLLFVVRGNVLCLLSVCLCLRSILFRVPVSSPPTPLSHSLFTSLFSPLRAPSALVSTLVTVAGMLSIFVYYYYNCDCCCYCYSCYSLISFLFLSSWYFVVVLVDVVVVVS